MRITLSCRRFFRPSVVFLSLLAAGFAGHAQTTTFAGTVYSPLGATSGAALPLPNILVFVEDPNNPAPSTFDKGVSIPNGGCAAQPSLVPVSVLGSASSKPNGTYSFNVAGVLPDPVNLYIQAGKWRLKTSVPLANIKLGGSNTFTLNMPSAAGASTNTYGVTAATLPNIAVVTGTADDVECIFPQIGISSSEVSDPSGTGHINFFLGNGSGGEEYSASTPTETQLVSGTVPMTNYDLVIFGCQGPNGHTEADTTNSTYLNNVESYANSGGRIFAVHWEFPWINNEPDWAPLSSFSSSTATANGTQTGTLATTGNFYTGEPTLAAWMNAIGAFDDASKLQFTLTNVFPNNVLAVNAPAQDWINVTVSPFGTTSNQFSFDTPLGATGTPTATVNFSNSTSTFLTGDPDDVVTATVSNTSSTPTTSGLTLTLTVPSVVQILSVADSSGGAWNCVAASATSYTCTLGGILAAGASDSVAISFKIPLGTTLGLYSLNGVLSGGGLNQSTQCGRVLYNDYHVEKAVTAKTLWNSGANCTTAALTNAQKFLEYSLYNLSSFVAPANSDTIQIQSSSAVTWVLPSPLYYGTYISQIEVGSVLTPGTTNYTISPAGTDLLDPGTYNFTLKFTPTDTTDYLSATSTQPVTILQDPTTAEIDMLDTSIYYGQEIGYDNGVDATINIEIQPGLPNLLSYPVFAGGAEVLTIDGTTVCSGIVGTPISGTGRCPDAGFLGWNAGPHTLYLSYAGTKDFSPSNNSYTVVINPDPTSTTLSTTGTGTSTLGDNVTYVAAVADQYANAVGTVTFYDSATAVAAGSTAPAASPIYSTAVVNGAASMSLATLSVGTHNVLACFVAPNDSAGLPNMAPSCSASTPQVVGTIPISPEGTATFVISSANPSPFGNTVTFTATVKSTGAILTVPTGTVTFLDNGVSIGTGTLDANGNTILVISTLAIGTHPITVSYAGTTTMAASASAMLSEVIVSSGTDGQTGFLLRVTPVIVPVFVGSTGTATVTIIPLTNFNQPVTLSCAGMPAQATCTFGQTTIAAGGGTTTLLLSAGSPHDCGVNDPYFATFGGRGGLALLSLSTLTLCLARRRRKLQAVALAVLLLALPTVLSGCGSGSCTDFAVKPGDYSFTVTATTGAVPVVSGSGSSSTTSTSLTQSQAMIMRATLQ